VAISRTVRGTVSPRLRVSDLRVSVSSTSALDVARDFKDPVRDGVVKHECHLRVHSAAAGRPKTSFRVGFRPLSSSQETLETLELVMFDFNRRFE
jgi:hypothetical protein